MPTSVVVAGTDSSLTTWVQQCFTTERFRVYTNPDLVGVELAGALKNVIGIAAGIGDGLGFGDNAKSALIARGLVELTRFGVALGAEHDTFHGLAGIGDLITTCFSRHGRNRRVGERLGRGEPLDAILATLSAIAEGVTTAKSVHDRIQSLGLEMPITSVVYKILYEGVSPAEGVAELMTRRSKSERARRRARESQSRETQRRDRHVVQGPVAQGHVYKPAGRPLGAAGLAQDRLHLRRRNLIRQSVRAND